jgi:hypothetical protein
MDLPCKTNRQQNSYQHSNRALKSLLATHRDNKVAVNFTFLSKSVFSQTE